MIRTLIADDTLSYRTALAAVLQTDPEFNLVGVAADGAEAVTLARTHRPDLILMDVLMPGMDGLAATARIMADTPTAVVVMSTLMDTQSQQLVFEALRAGAVDVVGKPRDVRDARVRERLLTLLKAMAGVKVVRHRTAGSPTVAPMKQTDVQLVVIGSSTGGPPALLDVLRPLPASYPAPVVIAQHLAVGFAQGLQQWLARSLSLTVKLVDGTLPLLPGVVYLAADDHHLEIRDWDVCASRAGKESPVPSVDRLMRSAAAFGERAVGVILTGMGGDGAEGLVLLRNRGGHTIVQDEATSLIYGMPRVAKERGGAVEELPLNGIGPRLVGLVNKGSRR